MPNSLLAARELTAISDKYKLDSQSAMGKALSLLAEALLCTNIFSDLPDDRRRYAERSSVEQNFILALCQLVRNCDEVLSGFQKKSPGIFEKAGILKKCQNLLNSIDDLLTSINTLNFTEINVLQNLSGLKDLISIPMIFFSYIVNAENLGVSALNEKQEKEIKEKAQEYCNYIISKIEEIESRIDNINRSFGAIATEDFNKQKTRSRNRSHGVSLTLNPSDLLPETPQETRPRSVALSSVTIEDLPQPELKNLVDTMQSILGLLENENSFNEDKILEEFENFLLSGANMLGKHEISRDFILSELDMVFSCLDLPSKRLSNLHARLEILLEQCRVEKDNLCVELQKLEEMNHDEIKLEEKKQIAEKLGKVEQCLMDLLSITTVKKEWRYFLDKISISKPNVTENLKNLIEKILTLYENFQLFLNENLKTNPEAFEDEMTRLDNDIKNLITEYLVIYYSSVLNGKNLEEISDENLLGTLKRFADQYKVEYFDCLLSLPDLLISLTEEYDLKEIICEIEGGTYKHHKLNDLKYAFESLSTSFPGVSELFSKYCKNKIDEFFNNFIDSCEKNLLGIKELYLKGSLSIGHPFNLNKLEWIVSGLPSDKQKKGVELLQEVRLFICLTQEGGLSNKKISPSDSCISSGCTLFGGNSLPSSNHQVYSTWLKVKNNRRPVEEEDLSKSISYIEDRIELIKSASMRPTFESSVSIEAVKEADCLQCELEILKDALKDMRTEQQQRDRTFSMALGGVTP